MSETEIVENIPDLELFEKNKIFIQSLSPKESIEIFTSDKYIEIIPEYFFFDPNSIQGVGLNKLGLNNNVISNILKYRSKGGFFENPEDLKKIYGLDDEVFSSLKEWIRIENREKEESEQGVGMIDKDKATDSFIEYDLNTVEYKDLLAITKGDSWISGRIIKYRKLLGGYYSIHQLTEVYDMSDSTYNLLCNNSRIDSSRISKLSLNNSNYSDFLKHPYIKKENVDLIMKYREFKKSEIDFIEFTESGLLPDSIMDIIKPYLKN